VYIADTQMLKVVKRPFIEHKPIEKILEIPTMNNVYFPNEVMWFEKFNMPNTN